MCAGSPLTVMRPSAISCSMSRREPMPACASTFCSLGASGSAPARAWAAPAAGSRLRPAALRRHRRRTRLGEDLADLGLRQVQCAARPRPAALSPSAPAHAPRPRRRRPARVPHRHRAGRAARLRLRRPPSRAAAPPSAARRWRSLADGAVLRSVGASIGLPRSASGRARLDAGSATAAAGMSTGSVGFGRFGGQPPRASCAARAGASRQRPSPAWRCSLLRRSAVAPCRPAARSGQADRSLVGSCVRGLGGRGWRGGSAETGRVAGDIGIDASGVQASTGSPTSAASSSEGCSAGMPSARRRRRRRRSSPSATGPGWPGPGRRGTGAWWHTAPGGRRFRGSRWPRSSRGLPAA